MESSKELLEFRGYIIDFMNKNNINRIYVNRYENEETHEGYVEIDLTL